MLVLIVLLQAARGIFGQFTDGAYGTDANVQTTIPPFEVTGTRHDESTTASNTPPPGFDIQSPYMEVALDGPMITQGGYTMTMWCLNEYTKQFQKTLSAELSQAQQQISCLMYNGYQLSTSYVNMLAVETEVHIAFGVNSENKYADSMSNIESCSVQLGSYLSSFSNWRQPIWTTISGCPELVFISSQFYLQSISWQCPTAS